MGKLKFHMKWLLPAFALLLVLTGCQPVGGFDVNKALTQSSDVKSSISSLDLSLKMKAAGTLTAEDQQAIDLINSAAIHFDAIKQQSNGELSGSGAFEVGKLKVPFQVYLTEKVVAFTVEGAKQPFYLPLNEVADQAPAPLSTEETEAMSKLLSEYLVKHLPNPSTLSATNVTETVHGEKQNLTKLHAELTGDELPVLLKTMLQSVSNDDSGLKSVLSGLYDYIAPLLKQPEGQAALKELGLSGISLEDKDAVLKLAFDTIKQGIDSILLSYDQAMKQAYQEEPELQIVFGKDSKMTADFYFDNALQTRKQTLNFTLALPYSQDEDIPVSSVSIQVNSEVWNSGGDIKVDPIELGKSAVLFEDAMASPVALLNSFEPDSDIYGLLRNDLGIARQVIVINPKDNSYGVIVKNNTAMAPLLYLTQDLDATIKVNSGKFIVTDQLNGGELEFKKGSITAVIKGKEVKAPQPVFIDKNGRAYVPLRVLAEGLGASVYSDGNGNLVIDRP